MIHQRLLEIETGHLAEAPTLMPALGLSDQSVSVSPGFRGDYFCDMRTLVFK